MAKQELGLQSGPPESTSDPDNPKPEDPNKPSVSYISDGTPDDDTGDTVLQSFQIKDNFLTKVYSGTNGFQLPFIFQPDHNVEEYAICRVNQNSVVFTQEAHRVYGLSLNVEECW